MMSRFFDWCGRNVELIIWLNIGFLFASAADQLTHGNLYPMGLCILLLAVVVILRR